MRGNVRRRNGIVVTLLVSVICGMVGLSFAAVPLYDLFCRVTGLGGTTQVAEAAGDVVLDRRIRVRFTADTNANLPWRFAAETREMELRVGEPGLVYYKAENTGSTPVAGTAVYNVNPAKAGRYFSKVQCFCFEEQVLQPGQQVDLPVYFFVDPALADDPGLDDVTTITLSYTFYRAKSDELDDAEEDYYRSATEAAAPATIPESRGALAMLKGTP